MSKLDSKSMRRRLKVASRTGYHKVGFSKFSAAYRGGRYAASIATQKRTLNVWDESSKFDVIWTASKVGFGKLNAAYRRGPLLTLVRALPAIPRRSLGGKYGN